jgi:hypothetical protein
MAEPMSNFSSAMINTDGAAVLAAAQLSKLLSVNVELEPLSASYGPPYDTINGKEDVIKILKGVPVEAVGCYFQEADLPSSVGYMILYPIGQPQPNTDKLSKPVLVTLQYGRVSKTFEKIHLKDLTLNDRYQQLVRSLNFPSNSVCSTKIIPWFSNATGRRQLLAATQH